MNSPNFVVGGALWEPEANDKVRILIKYKDLYRSIFWFQVKKDGSLYFGPRYISQNSVKMGSKTVTGNKITIKYDDDAWAEITDPAKIKGAHLSRHASGIVHGGEQRSFLEPIENVNEPTLEFFIGFEHPLKYPVISNPKKRDCLITYPINEKFPLYGWVYVSSKKNYKPIRLANVKKQFNLSFEYNDLQISNRVFQLILCHSKEGKWFPKTFVVWREKS